MADPTETLAMQTGNPDAGFTGLGLMTPDLLQQERAANWQNMLQQAGQMNPYRAIGLMAGRGLNNVDQAVSGSIGQNPADPMMQQAQRNQAILEAARQASSQAGADPLAQQAAFYQTVYQHTGSPQALQMLAKVRQAVVDSQQKQAGAFKDMAEGNKAANAGQETVETGIPGQPDMVQRYQWNPTSQRYDIPIGQPTKRNTGVQVSVGDKDSLPFYTEAAKAFAPQYQAAQQTNVGAIQTVDRALGLLNQGVITGTGADQREALNNVAVSLGLKDASQLANTEAFRSAISNLARLSAKGLTSRITQWELQWLNSMQGGDINKALPVLQKILQTVRQGHVDAIGAINKRAGVIRTAVPSAGGLFPDIDIPQADDSPQAGAGPAPQAGNAMQSAAAAELARRRAAQGGQ